MGDFLLGIQPEIESLEKATEESLKALTTGQAFVVGSVVNVILAGLAAYVLMLVLLLIARRPAIVYLRNRSRG